MQLRHKKGGFSTGTLVERDPLIERERRTVNVCVSSLDAGTAQPRGFQSRGGLHPLLGGLGFLQRGDQLAGEQVLEAPLQRRLNIQPQPHALLRHQGGGHNTLYNLNVIK